MQADREQSFALEDSLHGREILAVQAIKLHNGKHLVVTGSEDTYLKVCEYSQGHLNVVQTFSNHVASVRCLCKVKLNLNVQEDQNT